MKIFAASAFLIFMLSSQNASTQVFLGNSGDGVLLENGQIRLTELSSFQDHELYVGPSLDSEILKLVQTSPFLSALGIDHELMPRKLTDLDRRFRGLGRLLAFSSFLYRVDFSNEKLPLNSNPVKNPLEQRVQLALRNSLFISIASDFFYQLSPKNQVALVLHEMISPYGKSTCPPPLHCSPLYQPAVGNLVRLFFMKEGDEHPGLVFPNKLTDLKEYALMFFSLSELVKACGDDGSAPHEHGTLAIVPQIPPPFFSYLPTSLSLLAQNDDLMHPLVERLRVVISIPQLCGGSKPGVNSYSESMF